MIYDVNLAEGLFRAFVEQNQKLGIVNSSNGKIIDSKKIAEILNGDEYFVLRQRKDHPDQLICNVRKNGEIDTVVFKLSLLDQKVSALYGQIKLEDYLKTNLKGFKPLTNKDIQNQRYDTTDQPNPRYEEETTAPIEMEEENKPSSFELISQLTTLDYKKYNVYIHTGDEDLKKTVKNNHLNKLNYCFTLDSRKPKKLIVFYKTEDGLETKKFALMQSNGKWAVSYKKEPVLFVDFINAFLKKKKLAVVEMAPQAIAPIVQVSDPSKPTPVTFEELKEAFKDKRINGEPIPFHDTYCDQPLTSTITSLILSFPGFYLIRKSSSDPHTIVFSGHTGFKKDEKTELKEYPIKVVKMGDTYIVKTEEGDQELEKMIFNAVIGGRMKPFDMEAHCKYDLYNHYGVDRLRKYFADNKISFPIYKKVNDQNLTVENAKAVIQSSPAKRTYMFIETELFNTITLITKDGADIEEKALTYAFSPEKQRIKFFTSVLFSTVDLLEYEQKELKEKGFEPYKDLETDPLSQYKNKSYKLT